MSDGAAVAGDFIDRKQKIPKEWHKKETARLTRSLCIVLSVLFIS